MSFVLVAIAVLSLAIIATALVGPSAHALAGGPSVEPASRELVLRFIERSRRYRRGGAWAGIALAGLVGVIAEAEGHPQIGARGMNFPVLFPIGLGGSVAGSVLAEAFRFRPRRGARTVSLEVRDLSRYDDPLTANREAGLAGVAVLAAVGGVVVGDPAVSLWMVPMTVLVVLRRWATRRIALRPRPAVAPELAAADDHVRELAASAGLGRPLTTLVLLLLCMQLGDLNAAAAGQGPDGRALEGILAAYGGFGSFFGLLLAIAWWAANRSFGLVPRAAERVSLARLARGGLVAAVVLLPILVVMAARS